MNAVQPGGTIGVLGSGQLGRMFAFSAKRMGYRVHVYSPDRDTPAGQVADLEIQAPYGDLDAVQEFARGVDVVTFEFENIPLSTVAAVEPFAPVRPGRHVLHVTQNRLREKRFLSEGGFPVPSFQPIKTLADLEQTCRFPAVLKTATCGYDGKGQVRIDSADEISAAWAALNCDEAVLEEFVDFECELSVVAARGGDGDFACYGPMLNHHRDHILDISVCPSGLPERVTREAIEIAAEVLARLEVVGVLCVEFFLRRDGRLLINELAPRPHNSGHLTIDAHLTSQFDQQVRAVCGLPLGSTTQLMPAAMANILGHWWNKGVPNWQECVAGGNTRLHLYGKHDPLPARKMGHVTALAASPRLAAERARHAREALAVGRSCLEPSDHLELACK